MNIKIESFKIKQKWLESRSTRVTLTQQCSTSQQRSPSRLTVCLGWRSPHGAPGFRYSELFLGEQSFSVMEKRLLFLAKGWHGSLSLRFRNNLSRFFPAPKARERQSAKGRHSYPCVCIPLSHLKTFGNLRFHPGLALFPPSTFSSGSDNLIF